MANALILDQFDGNYSENLMNEWGSFFIPYTWALFSGSGSAVVNNEKTFKGFNSLKITNNSTSGAINVWSGITQDVIELEAGSYYISFSVYNPNVANISGRLFVYDALTQIDSFPFNMNNITNKWVTFGQVLTLASTTQLQLSYQISGNGATSVTYIDGIKIEKNDRLNGSPSAYSIPKLALPISLSFISPTLNYGTVTANDYVDITTEAIGAVVGDVVILGKPILTDHYDFTAFVSDTDEVTIRCFNYSGGSVVVGNKVFKFKIIK